MTAMIVFVFWCVSPFRALELGWRVHDVAVCDTAPWEKVSSRATL